mgnify:CR=1 FL=1
MATVLKKTDVAIVGFGWVGACLLYTSDAADE